MKKTILLSLSAFMCITHAHGQSWGNTAPNTLFARNSTLGVTPVLVGIGTNTPTAQLHTTQNVRHSGLFNNNALTRIIASDAAGNLAWRDASTLNGWLLTGNAGTSPATDFIGTTDAQPLVIKTDNIEQMRVNAPNSLGVGVIDIGQGGSANGSMTIHGRDIVGYSFPFIVESDISGATYTYTGGTTNTLGRMMRFDQTTSTSTNYYDLGIGQDRDFYITEKSSFGGPYPGGVAAFPKKMISISEDDRVGINMGFFDLPTADFHTVGSVRHEGLTPNTGTPLVVDGNGNVYTSSTPFAVNSCGTPNKIPMIDAAGNLSCSQIFDDGLNSVGIGMAAPGPYTYTAFPAPAATLGAPAAGGNIRLDVAGMTRCASLVVTSDAKYKTQITALENSLDKVMKLNGVEYYWKAEQYGDKHFDNLKHSGFLAQELAKVLPNTVISDKAGDLAVDYNSIIPVLTEAIKEQQKQIEELKKALNLQSTTSANTDVLHTKAMLYQNTPNPFNQQTEIRYKLPENAANAAILVFDMSGKQIRIVKLQGGGDGQITFSAAELAAGMYLYSLVLDGQEIDTKRMILTQ